MSDGIINTDLGRDLDVLKDHELGAVIDANFQRAANVAQALVGERNEADLSALAEALQATYDATATLVERLVDRDVPNARVSQLRVPR